MRVHRTSHSTTPQPLPVESSAAAVQSAILSSMAEVQHEAIASAIATRKSTRVNTTLKSAAEPSQLSYDMRAAKDLMAMDVALNKNPPDHDAYIKAKHDLDSILDKCSSDMQNIVEQVPFQSWGWLEGQLMSWLTGHTEEIKQSINSAELTEASSSMMDFISFYISAMKVPGLAQKINNANPGGWGWSKSLDSLMSILPKLVISYYYQLDMPANPAKFKSDLEAFIASMPIDYKKPDPPAEGDPPPVDYFAEARDQLSRYVDELFGKDRKQPPVWPAAWLSPTDYLLYDTNVFSEFLDHYNDR